MDLSEIRHGLELTGKVAGCLDDGTTWALRLGIWNNSALTLLQEGAYRFHPSAPIVSLWISQERLQEYERRCKINKEYACAYNVSAQRCPYAPSELADMASAVLTLNLDEINGMINQERAKEGPLKRLVPFWTRQGYVPVLEIVFKPPAKPGFFKKIFRNEKN